MKEKYWVDGHLVDRKTGKELPGVQVEVLDNELNLTDPIGKTVTGENGEFHMEFDDAWFKQLFRNREPDLHLRFSTDQDVVLSSMENESIDIHHPVDKVIKVDMIKKDQRYEMEGKILCEKDFDFSKIELTIMAYVDGKPIARAPITPEGNYKLEFKYVNRPPMIDLRVIPTSFIRKENMIPAVSKKVMPGAFMLREEKKIYHVNYDVLFPRLLLDRLIPLFRRTYHVHGAVYSFGLSTVEPIGGLKLDFYEVDPMIWRPPFNLFREDNLGTAYTDPFGVYSFDFNFAWLQYKSWIWPDFKPDIRVRISQFRDGDWEEVYRSGVDWNIDQDQHKDFFIPRNKLIPVPMDEARPVTGFRYTSLGLLPLDHTRLVKGYATTFAGDPISLNHQPFALTLRLFGLFGANDKVATYKVQIARANEDSPMGAWEDLDDPLYNRVWNAGTRRWDVRFMGPDPATGRYLNIDYEPVYKWHEHSLKIAWNSRRVTDGYWAIRMVGYDKAGKVINRAMPSMILRIDNSVPNADLKALHVTDCGKVDLPVDRDLELRFTAYDSAKHLWSYHIHGTRGKGASGAGVPINAYRPNGGQGWVNKKIDFHINNLPAEMSQCKAMAYNFELHVQGSATNGYSPRLNAQRVKKEINLIVAEP